MRTIVDLHIHSKYSRATSPKMDIHNLAIHGKMKGLDVIGTGDFTHPVWLRELKGKLEGTDNGLFKYKDMNFILTSEVCTIFPFENKTRKIHHVIHVPSLEVVEQINEVLAKHGKIHVDGRPILSISAPELVEILIEISKDIMITPAHVWTPWFGVLGSKSGFDMIKDCYQDQIKHIFSLETGLSSDPAMNWRLSALDKFTLLSNSDSHSPWVWRIGRECNVLDLKKISYKKIIEVIKKKDKKRFLFTIETSPDYGKYHFTGHRNCGISLHPKEASKFDNICSKCGRKLTIGVLQRVEELADRPEGFVPKDSIPFKELIPLYEIISSVLGVNQLYSKRVISEQDKLTKKFGTEFNVLLEASKEDLLKTIDEKIADAIIKTREGKTKYIAGYDGVYGRVVFSDEEFKKLKRQQEIRAKEQKRLVDF